LSVEGLRRLAEALHELEDEWFPDPKSMSEECWGCLAGILQAVQEPVFGKVKYPDPWERSTALLVRISRRHCLPNGNKRLASAAFLATIFFNLETFYPDLDEEQAKDRLRHAEQAAIKALAVIAARTDSNEEEALISDVTPTARRAMTLAPLPEDGSEDARGQG